MKLFEHEDFQQAIIQAADYFRDRGLRESIIEKDYFVTEALRTINANVGSKVIFKGGTSLSKGWNLIQRFSEDIDIFLDPQAYAPPLSMRGIDRELKQLRDALDKHPAFTFLTEESKTIGGFGRNDRFLYRQYFTGNISPNVLVEAGTASGREPTEIVSLQSYIGTFLQETGKTLGAEDEAPFSMQLLHFRRTFVEKLFAIHCKVELRKRDGIPIGSYARHYYDLYQLVDLPKVQQMLRSDEYERIKTDYDALSQKHFPKNYFAPDGMSFRNSSALFPPEPLVTELRDEFAKQCRSLCFGSYPVWDQVQAKFESMRDIL